jgi:hemerythrin-like metal-binding protein
MSTLEWSDALALDLPEMDDTHREFVELLADVEDAADAQIDVAWSALILHTDDHFGREDRWMRDTRYAPSNCHTTQHFVVLKVMREIEAMDRADKPAVIRQVARELAQWFPQHAQGMDASLALHLRGVGYDAATGTVALPEALPAEAITGCGSAACSPRAATADAEA